MLRMTGKKKGGITADARIIYLRMRTAHTDTDTAVYGNSYTARTLDVIIRLDCAGNEFHIYRNRKLSVYVPG